MTASEPLDPGFSDDHTWFLLADSGDEITISTARSEETGFVFVVVDVVDGPDGDFEIAELTSTEARRLSDYLREAAAITDG